jgi:hypothetical protein
MTTTRHTTTIPQAVTDYIQTISTDQDRYLEFYNDLVRWGRKAGVPKQQLLDNVNSSFEDSKMPGGSAS